LRELGELADCDAMVDPADLCLNRESELELADKANFINANNVEIFKTWASRPTSGKRRRCYFRFLESPVTLLGQSHLERLVLERNRLEGEPNRQAAKGTGQRRELSCGLLFRSVGYRGVPIPGVPFDERNGVFPNAEGRLLDNDRSVIPNLYATGWIKRGPSGVIGTNRADSVATVNALLADLPKLDSGDPKTGAEALYPLLARRSVRVVGYADWLKIDTVEIEGGKPKGKPREKLTTVKEMLSVLD
jgi:ferredoxin/flavodoxin---NADP+ reductase